MLSKKKMAVINRSAERTQLMTVAVLALQGAFAEHEKILSKLGADSFEIRQKKDLDRSFDRLIIPGGESTVQGKLLRELDLFDGIKSRIEGGMPVYGTCAGLILLAKSIDGVYDSDPAKNADAVKFDTITYDEVLKRHLAVMDSTATSLSMDNHIPVLVFALKDPENIIRALRGEKIGTIVKED